MGFSVSGSIARPRASEISKVLAGRGESARQAVLSAFFSVVVGHILPYWSNAQLKPLFDERTIGLRSATAWSAEWAACCQAPPSRPY